MNILRELYDHIRFRTWDWQMRGRRSEEEMWLWEDVTVHGKWDKRIRVFGRPKNWPQMIVNLEMAQSNGDASRLVKSNAFQMRDWCLDTPWATVDLKTPLPNAPTLIRRGKAFHGIKMIWLPPENVSEKFGDLTLRSGGY